MSDSLREALDALWKEGRWSAIDAGVERIREERAFGRVLEDCTLSYGRVTPGAFFRAGRWETNTLAVLAVMRAARMDGVATDAAAFDADSATITPLVDGFRLEVLSALPRLRSLNLVGWNSHRRALIAPVDPEFRMPLPLGDLRAHSSLEELFIQDGWSALSAILAAPNVTLLRISRSEFRGSTSPGFPSSNACR